MDAAEGDKRRDTMRILPNVKIRLVNLISAFCHHSEVTRHGGSWEVRNISASMLGGGGGNHEWCTSRGEQLLHDLLFRR